MSNVITFDRGRRMQKLILKDDPMHVSFCQSEETIWDQYRRSKDYKGPLGANECYIFVSLQGTVMFAVLRDGEKVLDTRRWRRRDSQPWCKEMLREYGQEAGLDLVNVKPYAERFTEYREQRKLGTWKPYAWQKFGTSKDLKAKKKKKTTKRRRAA